jgi:hypothetical protein
VEVHDSVILKSLVAAALPSRPPNINHVTTFESLDSTITQHYRVSITIEALSLSASCISANGVQNHSPKARLTVLDCDHFDHAVGYPTFRHPPPASKAKLPKIAPDSCTPAASTAQRMARSLRGSLSASRAAQIGWLRWRPGTGLLLCYQPHHQVAS